MKFILDQNLPRRTSALLRDLGIDCLHVGEIGMSRAKDSDIIDWALREDRVCVTRDADFHALLADRQAVKPSVIRIRIEDLDALETADLIRLVLNRFSDELLNGAAITVTSSNIRCRRLPIGGN